MTDLTFPAYVAAALDPDFVQRLGPKERMVLYYMAAAWLRPDQYIPPGPWRMYGFQAGRGKGKSHAIATYMNQEVMRGRVRRPALMAPHDKRTRDVQVRFLVETSPPWFKAQESRGGVLWPNGVWAEPFTAEAPGGPRGSNIDLAWLTEIVDWTASGRLEAYRNIATATRKGAGKIVWDTTSKGKNEVIQHLHELNASDPERYPISRGTLFDNPLLSRDYLYAVVRQYSGRRYEEEVNGRIYAESAGALWQQLWFDNNRVEAAPPRPELRLVAIDPGLSTRDDADPTGLVVGSCVGGHAYWEEDHTARRRPEDWGDIAVYQCRDNGAAGVVIERNHMGDEAEYVIRTRAKEIGFVTRKVDPKKPFPRRTAGVVYVKEKVAASSKDTRARGPATATEAGRVHVVGRLDELEFQCTTWEPGESKSPNALDAASYLTIELLELDRDGRRPQQIEQTRKASQNLSELLNVRSRRRVI